MPDARHFEKAQNAMHFYTGNPQNRQEKGWLDLPSVRADKGNDPEGYIPDEGLKDAVNVALTLSNQQCNWAEREY